VRLRGFWLALYWVFFVPAYSHALFVFKILARNAGQCLLDWVIALEPRYAIVAQACSKK